MQQMHVYFNKINKRTKLNKNENKMNASQKNKLFAQNEMGICEVNKKGKQN